jgi:hypothetical protein
MTHALGQTRFCLFGGLRLLVLRFVLPAMATPTDVVLLLALGLAVAASAPFLAGSP